MVDGGGVAGVFYTATFSRLHLFCVRYGVETALVFFFCFAVEWLTVTCNFFLRIFFLLDFSCWADLLLRIWLPRSSFPLWMAWMRLPTESFFALSGGFKLYFPFLVLMYMGVLARGVSGFVAGFCWEGN